jgi:Helix-turn-helix domain
MPQRYPTKSDLRREAEAKAGDDQIMTVAEAARLLKVHEITLFVWARENRGPPALTPNGVRLRRYSRKAVFDWLYGHSRQAEAANA